MKDFEVVDGYDDKLKGVVAEGHAFLATEDRNGKGGCEVELRPDHANALRNWLSAYLDAPTAPKLVIPEEPDTAEDPAAPQRVSDVDKLRLLAAVVDAQAPFGTDLANFKRRLQIVLGL